jgi:hypothetical protein
MALVLLPEGMDPYRGTIIAYDAGARELARIYGGGPVGPTLEIDRAWTMLLAARDSIFMDWDPHTLASFTLEREARLGPTVTWNDSPTATPNEVSVRGPEAIRGTRQGRTASWRAVLVSATPAGQTFCISLTYSEEGSLTTKFGTQDAQSNGECNGDWPGAS